MAEKATKRRQATEMKGNVKVLLRGLQQIPNAVWPLPPDLSRRLTIERDSGPMVTHQCWGGGGHDAAV